MKMQLCVTQDICPIANQFLVRPASPAQLHAAVYAVMPPFIHRLRPAEICHPNIQTIKDTKHNLVIA